MAVNNTAGRPELPDLVIHEILRRLPTKAAVGISFLFKQWEGVLSCLPTLDFDEGGDEYDRNKLQKHYEFINILKRCLLLCEKETQKVVLDKFRLRMTNYLCPDAITVSKWLSYSFERSVKEVVISLSVSKLQRWLKKNYYCLSMTNFVNAKSMTSLNLEYVRLKNIRRKLEQPAAHTCLLPSLKKMSFKTVYFDRDALSCLLEECPAVECLSLISCSFAGLEISVPSTSLKSLEIKHCKASLALVLQAVNLESVIVVSPKSPLEAVILTECYNLKYINVYGNWRMNMFHVNGCHDVKGTINAPNLGYFSYEGYLKSKFSLNAPKLTAARILLWDIWGGEAPSFDPWEHFPKLTDFLKEVGSSKEMILLVRDFKALIFPKDFRRTLSASILPELEVLEYAAVVPATGRDKEELMQSLQWMAPLATYISQLEYNAELDMYGNF